MKLNFPVITLIVLAKLSTHCTQPLRGVDIFKVGRWLAAERHGLSSHVPSAH